MEDEIVCREILPVNPAGPGLLKVNLQGENGDPSQLLALEYVPNVPADPWKMTELGESGRRFSAWFGNVEMSMSLINFMFKHLCL